MIKVNKEIELKDVINICIVILGGLLTYFLITSVTTRNDTIRTMQLLFQETNDLRPNVQLNYTNELTASKDTLRIKVYLKNNGKYPVFTTSPNLYLLVNNDTIQYYNTPDLNNFWGVIGPDSEYFINYTFFGFATDSIPTHVRMTYPVNTDKSITSIFSELMTDAFKSIDDEYLNTVTRKNYLYFERVYVNGTNPIWQSFSENPR